MVFYEQRSPRSGGSGGGGEDHTGPEAPARRLVADHKLEASGSVTVVPEDQTATGDGGLLEHEIQHRDAVEAMCLVSQGPNVMRGEKLVVDLTTGVSRVNKISLFAC